MDEAVPGVRAVRAASVARRHPPSPPWTIGRGPGSAPPVNRSGVGWSSRASETNTQISASATQMSSRTPGQAAAPDGVQPRLSGGQATQPVNL